MFVNCVTDEQVDIIDELNDWDANSCEWSWTFVARLSRFWSSVNDCYFSQWCCVVTVSDDDMYGGDAGVYSSESRDEEDEERYPGQSRDSMMIGMC